MPERKPEGKTQKKVSIGDGVFVSTPRDVLSQMKKNPRKVLWNFKSIHEAGLATEITAKHIAEHAGKHASVVFLPGTFELLHKNGLTSEITHEAIAEAMKNAPHCVLHPKTLGILRELDLMSAITPEHVARAAETVPQHVSRPETFAILTEAGMVNEETRGILSGWKQSERDNPDRAAIGRPWLASLAAKGRKPIKEDEKADEK